MKLFTEEIELKRDQDASKNQAIDNKLFDLVLNLNNLSNTESGIDKLAAKKAEIKEESSRIGTRAAAHAPPPPGSRPAPPGSRPAPPGSRPLGLVTLS